MASFYLNHRLRRLPVFFMLDTSDEMAGTFQVTMQDGLLVVKRELVQYGITSQCVYLGSVTFGGQATPYALVPLDAFTPPLWQAQGTSNLKPALLSLIEALMFDLIVARADHPGDYTPLVFLILGSYPSDEWEEALEGLAQFKDNRRPLIISLVTRPELIESVRTMSNYALLLQPAEAAYMTFFFFWVARTIVKACEDYERGATTIIFPELPYGVVVPPY